MKNIRIAALIKIIIPVYLLCAIIIFISFYTYNSAIQERNEILHRTLEGLGGALVWQATPALNNAEARSDAMYILLVFVIGISVVIVLASIFIIRYKLMPIKDLVNTAIELSKDNEIKISNDELGFLTRELADKIKLLEEAVEKANAASRAKSDFLSAMSHEMRTPMNAIIGMTSIAGKEKDPEKIAYALGRIETASAHLLGVINDILDISKIEINKMELSYINFNFSKMIDRVCNVVTTKMQDKKQNFVVDIDPSIPNYLHGDDHRLAQVIVNLLSNACKFTPEKGDITLSAKLKNKTNKKCEVELLVRDSGIGIRLEDQDKLFMKFQQAEAGTTRKYGGTGLGLAISKSIIEMMGGDIWVESEPDKGSGFYFTVVFEIPDSNEIDDELMSDSDAEKYDDIDLTGKKILVVDDVEINLEIVIALLEPTGVIIDTALSGIEAVEAISANPGRYDLIFMDVQMPGMDGYEASRQIRAMESPDNNALEFPSETPQLSVFSSKIPIIAMTANVFKEDIDKCMEAGMDGHLGKPIDIEEVMKILHQFLLQR